MRKHVLRYEIIARVITQRPEVEDQHSIKLLYKGDGTHWLQASSALELVVPPSFEGKPRDFVILTLECE